MAIDWELLKTLRSEFLAEEKTPGTYWTETALSAYDETFARRIRWKWDSVLKELTARWHPPTNWILVDWGCGTGVASEALLSFCASQSIPLPSEIQLWDRSELSMNFAKAKLQKLYPQILIKDFAKNIVPSTVLLLSHVLNELSDSDLNELTKSILKSENVFWVEPGTHAISRRLIEVREKIRNRATNPVHFLAPCPHQDACGILSSGNEAHWCHHFAEPPSSIFQEKFWADFSKKLTIDLHRLPVSYFVIGQPQTPAPGTSRIIGKPRLYKGDGNFLLCSQKGVFDRRLLKRNHPELFKLWKRTQFSCYLPDEPES